MTERRFRLLLFAIRFDDIDEEDRRRRLSQDKLTKVREVFDEFVSNCKKSYTPSDRLTIDEMLESFKARCSFRQYMAKKPSKYVLKIFALVDSKTYFTLNMEVYVGLQPEGPRSHVRYSSEVDWYNATNMKRCGDLLYEKYPFLEPIVCMAHTFHSFITDILAAESVSEFMKEVTAVINKIRESQMHRK